MTTVQSQLRRGRARLVCLQCHNRKLKCDLEGRTKEGLASCSNCFESSSLCQLRASKRRRRDIHAARDGFREPYAPIRPAIAETPLGAEPVGQRLPEQQATVQILLPSPAAEQSASSLGTAPAASIADDTPGIPSTTSQGTATVGYLGTSGLLNLFEPDYRGIATNAHRSEVVVSGVSLPEIDLPPLELQQSFAETYFEYCWPWCPILDKSAFWHDLDESRSHLLVNALALLGTQVRPPIVQHSAAKDYYNRAKMLFYMDEESQPMVCLQAIMLFYWWAPRAPSQVHKDAAWWWTGIAIKYAQQMGLHREPRNVEDVGGPLVQGMRKRIWWTLFARERLTAMCQGRPLTINPEDCTVSYPSLADFGPSADSRAEIFIQWVNICSILGRVSQHLSRPAEQPSFPTHLAEQLMAWVSSLPQHLRLPDMSDRARTFDRHILKLHLPYLTTVTILHLNWSSQHPSQPLPEAYTAAILSASCVTRIFKDFLARGEIRFLGAIACWYVGVAIVALLHTQRIESLAESGADDIRVLRLALNELARLWPSTAIFVKGFDRLKAFENLGTGLERARSNTQPRRTPDKTSSTLSDLNWPHGLGWQNYFPHVTQQTCPMAGILLAEHQPEIWEDLSWVEDTATQFQNLFDSSDAVLDTFLENLSSLCWVGEPNRV